MAIEPSGKFTTPVEPEARGEAKFFSSLKPGNRWGLVPFVRQLSPRPGDPQTLDLLAMDREGSPWVFEFKRAVADHEAIGQLLGYGSWIAVTPTNTLIERVEATDPRRAPVQLFADFFSAPMPRRRSHSVFLVLVAHSFSPWCQRLADFLEASCGVRIGLLTMRLARPAGVYSSDPEFVWEREPAATRPQVVDNSSGRPFLLSLKKPEAAKHWPHWSKNGIIELPKRASRHARILRSGSRLFVAVCGRGLIGYGLVVGSRAKSERGRRESNKTPGAITIDWQWQGSMSRPTLPGDFSTRTSKTVRSLSKVEDSTYRMAIMPDLPSANLAAPRAGHPPKSNRAPAVSTGVRSAGGSIEFKQDRVRRAFALFNSGSAQSQVARALNVSNTSAGRWHDQWVGQGGAAAPKPARLGRPSALSEKHRKILIAILRKPPAADGKRKAGKSRWTVALLREFVKRRFRIDYHLSHCHRLLKRFRPAPARAGSAAQLKIS